MPKMETINYIFRIPEKDISELNIKGVFYVSYIEMAISTKRQKTVNQNGSLRLLPWAIWTRTIWGYLVNRQTSWLVPDFLMRHLWGNFKYTPSMSKHNTKEDH